jgi:MarR family transcriptional regulator for hemolysin
MNGRPHEQPIGIVLSNTVREVERAFEDALEAVSGSRSVWLILMALKQGPLRNQRELAAMVGIEEATLTHHLNAMELNGLLTRRRDPGNRRVHLVELTADGEAAFHRMRETVTGFDRQLRLGIEESELVRLRAVLRQLRANITGDGVIVHPIGDKAVVTHRK